MIGLSNNLQPRCALCNGTKAAAPESDFVTDLNSDLRPADEANANRAEFRFSDKVPCRCDIGKKARNGRLARSSYRNVLSRDTVDDLRLPPVDTRSELGLISGRAVYPDAVWSLQEISMLTVCYTAAATTIFAAALDNADQARGPE